MTEKHFLATPVHMEVNGVLFVPIKALKKKKKKKKSSVFLETIRPHYEYFSLGRISTKMVPTKTMERRIAGEFFKSNFSLL